MSVMLFLAYRAILAEPRTKTTAAEDYSGGGSRGDYASGGSDSMNQYSFPMNTPLLGIYFLFQALDSVGYKMQKQSCSKDREEDS